MGNLTLVSEPDPAEGTVNTYYTYDLLNHLTQVSMRRLTLVSPPTYTTQTRTFTHEPATQRLTSAVNPENGTVSYIYNADSTPNYSTDARNQRTQYSYDYFGRVIRIDRYRSDGSQHPCQSVAYTYDDTLVQDAWASVNPRGRLTGVPVTLSASAQRNLNNALDSIADSSGCGDLAWAITLAYGFWNSRNDGNPLLLYKGLILTGFNSFNPAHPSVPYEQKAGSFGDGNTFYGVPDSYVSETPIRRIIRRPKPPRPPRPAPEVQ